VLALGGLDLARDGSGAVAYLRRSAGEAHVYASRLVDGRPRSPHRVDRGQSGSSSQVRVASADFGETAVAWVNRGRLYAAVRAVGDAPFGTPQLICACGGGADPSLDLSIYGTGYLTFTAPGAGGHDVRVAELDDERWKVLGSPLDVNGADDAKGARVAASGDGSGIAAFRERASSGRWRVYERRVVRKELSEAPRRASLAGLGGHSGGDADSPALDLQDDSSFVWVVFRQNFRFGGSARSRVVARRLAGSVFDTTVEIDGLGASSRSEARNPAIDLTGRGHGLAAAGITPANGVEGAAITRAHGQIEPSFQAPVGLDSGMASSPVAGINESGRGAAFWARGNRIMAAYFDGRRFAKAVEISNKSAGPTVAGLGLSSSASTSHYAVAFVQGDSGARRIQFRWFTGSPG